MSDDEKTGQAWAKQQGLSLTMGAGQYPVYFAQSNVYQTGNGPTIPLSVAVLFSKYNPDDPRGQFWFRTAEEFYAELGRALKEVWRLVPPLKG